MKNPLKKRLPRELKSEFGKYLVIFILMVFTIGFISGFLVADNSMILAYNESFEKYNIEDGNFRTAKQMTKSQWKAVEKLDVKLYENFYREQPLDNGNTLRIFKNREEVDKVCLMEGRLPENADEIAVDRMYADNNSLKTGDTILSEKKSWTITGLVALSDYSCLFQNNNDSMFDSVKFGVAIVNEEGFDALDQDKIQYNYSWIYNTKPGSEKEEKEVSEDFMKDLGSEVQLENFIPQYQNQAIHFTGDDMGSDKAMMIMLLYIVIAIMAFVFGITTGNTIVKESAVIGTLRASGYTRGELIRHYMTLPVLVTLVSAIVGNILGYTVFKDICAGMYYGSYSLPTYHTVWNAEAFLLTTVVPVLLMLSINYLILRHKMKLSPLKFLRRDLSGKKQKKAMHLNPRLKIFRRFRLRVIFQNRANYIMMFIGVIFANLLLMFGLLLPSALAHYQEEIQQNLLANYQYMLTVPVSMASGSGGESLAGMLVNLMDTLDYSQAISTDNPDAEAFSAYSLNTLPGKYKSEEITLYGIKTNSRYVDADVFEGVYISSAYADKFLLKPGDTITLKEKYEDDEYSFKIAGIYDYSAALCIFMPQKQLNETFDLGDGYIGGYFSDTEITDLNEKYVGTVIDLDALTKISRQLDVSMGDMMGLVNAFAVAIYLVLIYLLSKVIIEKNSQSISMTKILGYSNSEAARLYIVPTSIVVVVCVLVSLPIEKEIMAILFREVMLSMLNGWITLWIDPMIYVQMTAAGIISYGVVAALEYRRIRRIPMSEALKNVE